MFDYYHRDDSAGLNAVIEPNRILILRIVPFGQEVLLAPEVGLLVDHEYPTLHPAGAASSQVRRDFRAVTDALVRATLEVPLLKENNLIRKT